MSAAPRFRSVIFDCDSTLSSIEGIEELAGALRPEITRLTEAAMGGTIPLESVYGRRLDLIRPDREAVARLGRRYVETLVPGARETIAALRAAGIRVGIVSGGLLPAVRELARALGVPDEDVAAVDIRFDAAGGYAGFDAAAPLARAGGKLEVIAASDHRWPRPRLLVGDGATDLEARPAVDGFVVYAGVVAREPVMAAADAVLREPSLLALLPLVAPGGPDRAAAPSPHVR